MSQNMQQRDSGVPTINVEGLFNYDLFSRRKLTSFRDVVQEVMNFQAFQRYFVPFAEPLIRRVVTEEVQKAMPNQTTDMQRKSDQEMQPADPRILQLQFLNTISQPLYSESRIQAKEDTKMKVALIDASTGQIVSNEPISSAKVEIVVLDGDFNDDDGGDSTWTHDKFNTNIVTAREGKKPLLNGNVVLNLKEGVGFLGDISITDNSSWRRSRKFRLGARVINNRNEVRVREAKTGPFVVKDQRGELDQKHYPPNLNDEVWRLEKIRKNGVFHKRMIEKGIEKVKDFLILLYQDPAHLRNILKGMSDNMWEVTVKHARTCALDKRVNVYRPRPDENSGVVFNVVGQVTGLLRDGQYILVDMLSEADKAHARNLMALAFKHWEEVLTLDDDTSLHVEFSNSTIAGSSDGMNILTSDNDGFDYPQLYASTTDVLSPIIPLGNNNNMDNHELFDMEFFDEDIQFFGMHAGLLSADDDLMLDCFTESAENSRAKLRWRKLFCVLRWLTVRRIVARKAMLHK